MKPIVQRGDKGAGSSGVCRRLARAGGPVCDSVIRHFVPVQNSATGQCRLASKCMDDGPARNRDRDARTNARILHDVLDPLFQRLRLCRLYVRKEGDFMPVYGYARVSTDGQTLDAQVAQLRAAGAEKVFQEKVSGARIDRPQLARLLRALEPSLRPRSVLIV